MIGFWHAIEWFIYGFLAGWLLDPAWHLIKRIWQEAKVARDEWRRPRG
jgi:hypothetical protein